VDSVATSLLSITCDTTKLSGVPYTVFQSPAGNVYDKFCFNLDSTIGQEWTVNSQGNQQASIPSFDLKWETNTQTLGCEQNVESCRDVFRAITNSKCGRQGSKSYRASLKLGAFFLHAIHRRPNYHGCSRKGRCSRLRHILVSNQFSTGKSISTERDYRRGRA
jgi:hypothetical protein